MASDSSVAWSVEHLRITVKGGFAVEDASGRDLTPRGRKACAILAMLALAPEGTRSRLWLREHLWSDRADAEAMTSLRQSLSEIRRTLGPAAALVEADRRRVTLALDRTVVVDRGGEFLEDVAVRDPHYLAWRDGERARLAESPRSPRSRTRASDRILAGENGTNGAASSGPSFDPARVQTTPRPRRDRHPRVAVIARGEGTERLADALRRLLTEHRALRVLAEGASGAEYVVRVSPTRAESDRALILSVALETAGSGEAKGSGDLLAVERSDTARPDGIDFPALAAGRLVLALRVEECRRAVQAPDDRDLRNLLWRADWHLHHMNPRDAALAGELVERAHLLAPVDADVSNARAHVAMVTAWASRGRSGASERAEALAREAVGRDPVDARNFYVLGTALSFARRRLEARAAIAESLRLCRTQPLAWMQHGTNRTHDGRYEEALEALAVARAIGETDPRRYIIHGEIAMASLHLGRNGEASRAAEQAIAVRPRYWYAHMVRTVALLRAGDPGAGAARDALAVLRPDLAAADLHWLPNEDPGIAQRLAADLGLT